MNVCVFIYLYICTVLYIYVYMYTHINIASLGPRKKFSVGHRRFSYYICLYHLLLNDLLGDYVTGSLE